MTMTPELSGDRIQFLIETLNTTCEFIGFWKSPDRAKEFGSLLEKEHALLLAVSKMSFKLAEMVVSSTLKYRNCLLKEIMWESFCNVRLQKERKLTKMMPWEVWRQSLGVAAKRGNRSDGRWL